MGKVKALSPLRERDSSGNIGRNMKTVRVSTQKLEDAAAELKSVGEEYARLFLKKDEEQIYLVLEGEEHIQPRQLIPVDFLT